jgi:hypothetical protein
MLHLVGCNLELYYDAQTYECQIYKYCTYCCHPVSISGIMTAIITSYKINFSIFEKNLGDAELCKCKQL